MKSFSGFLIEAENNRTKVNNTIRQSFGRHQGMHLGHRDSLLYGLKNENAGDVDHRLYTSRSFDPKKNPLPQEFKEKHLQLAIPETKGLWDSDPKVRTPIDAMEKARADGYDNYEMVVGPDRVDSFKNMATRANPGFKNIEILTDPTLVRDPDLLKQKEGETPTKDMLRKRLIAGLSGSGQRRFAEENNFEKFKEGMGFGKHYDPYISEYFKALREGVDQTPKTRQIDNSYEPDREYIRELYKTGELFVVGDLVEHIPTYMKAKVHRCGANHVICVTEGGYMFKSFIHDLTLI